MKSACISVAVDSPRVPAEVPVGASAAARVRGRRRWFAACAMVVVGGLSASVAACGTKDQGAVVVAMQTDMKVDSDISGVAVYIQDPQGVVLFSTFAKAVPDGSGVNTVHLPATLVVGAQSGTTPQIRVRLVGFRTDSKNPDSALPTVVNEALITIPSTRIVTLPMGLTFVNQDTAAGSPVSFSGSANATAIGTQTFKSDDSSGYKVKDGECDNLNDVLGEDGECTSVPEYTEKDLPEYSAAEVFGGGASDGTGAACFDVGSCAASATRIDFSSRDFDVSTKRLVVSLKGKGVDLTKQALVIVVEGKNHVGFCPSSLPNGPCFVVLDSPNPERDKAFPKFAKYPYVYDAVAQTLTLKPRLAKRILGNVVGIFATDPACGTKPRGLPRCDAFAAKGTRIVGSGGPGLLDAGSLLDGSILPGSDSGGLPDTGRPGDGGGTGSSDAGVGGDTSSPDGGVNMVEAGPA